MVRLKVGYKFLITANTLFQFLMVRLKEISDNGGRTGKTYFNSLWCD